MGRLFLLREVIPGETSPVTWSFEEAKFKRTKVKFPLHRLPPKQIAPTKQPIMK